MNALAAQTLPKRRLLLASDRTDHSRELASVSRLVSSAMPATPSVKAFSAAVTEKVRLKIRLDSAFMAADTVVANAQLGLAEIPRLVALNKADLVNAETMAAIQRQVQQDGARECVAISATGPQTLRPLLEKAGAILARNLTMRFGDSRTTSIGGLSYPM